MRRVSKSLEEYGRGIIGGLLFSLPLLYTMEVWWAGFSSHPLHLILYVVATFVLLLGYNRFAGIRHDANFLEVVIDSVEEMGLGILISAIALLVLGRISFDMTLNEVVGKVTVEAMTIAIGVSVGTAQLGGGATGDSDTGEGQSGAATAKRGSGAGIHFAGQLVIALCGAVLFAANVAPTEEIVMIAAEISSLKLLFIALISIVLGAVILFRIDFKGAQQFAPGRGSGAMAVVIGSVITYAIALASSAMILWFFGRFDGQALVICIGQTVVLGLAATLGASAGRLLLQSK